MQPTSLRSLLLLCAIAAAPAAVAEPDWSKVPVKQLPLFYPGPSGLEWVMNGVDHSGARKLREQKQSCFDCHETDAEEIGNYVVAGRKVGRTNVVLDAEVPKGRRGSFPLSVQATHDAKKLYLRFEWESAEGDAGPALDPANEVKLSVMFDGGQVEGARLNGCWASCHMDLRTMPDAAPAASRHPKAKAYGWNDGVTKYLAESRTPAADDAKARGAWDKLRPPREIAAALKAGKFLDLMQFRSGEKAVDGYVLERRHMGGGKSLQGATGQKSGRKWSVTFERLLAAGGVGDHALEPGRQYTFGVSIHENHGAARFHHVSLGYTLGLDDPTAFVNAIRADSAASAMPALR